MQGIASAGWTQQNDKTNQHPPIIRLSKESIV